MKDWPLLDISDSSILTPVAIDGGAMLIAAPESTMVLIRTHPG